MSSLMSRILPSCETSFAHFSTNICRTIDAVLWWFWCRVLLLWYRYTWSLQVLMMAPIGLLLCSPPGDRSRSKLCLRRQTIKNITSIWAESSFTSGSLFIFIYSLSNPITFSFTWNDLPAGVCSLPSETHILCERMFPPSWNSNLLTSGC